MERLWIAGADYAGNGLGYIDGAIQSGTAAAKAIITKLQDEHGDEGDKTVTWP